MATSVKNKEVQQEIYLKVTATYITLDFKIKDVMLEIKYMSSHHIPVVITDSLHKIISDWKLEDHISSITTNNRTNMVVKAGPRTIYI
ncbi:hypothetical protein RhiirA5_437820 [Rhizophagus irregularis]|uniref:Uncharacterized protein n=1 Tax=Rhizophagus irregularis TaxID=588596 RepID=A0A2N0NJZ0_9GLOM|nr:hypothetical protein RhiirA5_437820 [Rhizophagus irregularis]